MPITTGSLTFTGSDITVECGDRKTYDRVKAEEEKRGIYTLTSEDILNLTLTFSANKIQDISTGTLP